MRKGFARGWEDGQRCVSDRMSSCCAATGRSPASTSPSSSASAATGSRTVALLGLALELTGSTAVASLVLVLQTAAVLPRLADRRRARRPARPATADGRRRRRCAPVAALAFLLARDPSMLWIALLAAAAISALSAFFEPTSSAALPNLVDEEDLPVANVLLGSAWGTMLAVRCRRRRPGRGRLRSRRRVPARRRQLRALGRAHRRHPRARSAARRRGAVGTAMPRRAARRRPGGHRRGARAGPSLTARRGLPAGQGDLRRRAAA